MPSHKLLRAPLLTLLLAALFTVGASAACEGVGTVNTGALRLRSEPSLESSILATALEGNHVILLEEAAEGWYKVDYNSVEGYMAADYLDVTAQADVDLGWGVVRGDEALDVHSGPDSQCPAIASLPTGSTAAILGVDNGWFKVLCGDTVGYVWGDGLQQCKDASGARGDDPVAEEIPLAQQVVAYAEEFLGTPYVYGAAGPNSFDCSGFTKYVYAHFGYSLNRSAKDQSYNGVPVSMSQLQPGDLVFFRTIAGSYISHVGMYVGDGVIIHASSGSRQIRYAQLYSAYFRNAYVCARRIITE